MMNNNILKEWKNTFLIMNQRNLIDQIKITLINIKVDLIKFFIIGELDEIVLKKWIPFQSNLRYL